MQQILISHVKKLAESKMLELFLVPLLSCSYHSVFPDQDLVNSYSFKTKTTPTV